MLRYCSDQTNGLLMQLHRRYVVAAIEANAQPEAHVSLHRAVYRDRSCQAVINIQAITRRILWTTSRFDVQFLHQDLLPKHQQSYRLMNLKVTPCQVQNASSSQLQLPGTAYHKSSTSYTNDQGRPSRQSQPGFACQTKQKVASSSLRAYYNASQRSS